MRRREATGQCQHLEAQDHPLTSEATVRSTSPEAPPQISGNATSSTTKLLCNPATSKIRWNNLVEDPFTVAASSGVGQCCYSLIWLQVLSKSCDLVRKRAADKVRTMSRMRSRAHASPCLACWSLRTSERAHVPSRETKISSEFVAALNRLIRFSQARDKTRGRIRGSGGVRSKAENCDMSCFRVEGL